MPPPIISNTCAYVNCRNDRRHTPGLSFYRFPLKDKDRCIQWLVNSGNVKIKLGDEHLKNGVICERHFAPHSFKDPAATKKSLNYNAIPRNYNDVVWTTDDKNNLLRALQTHGPDNIKAVADEMPFKSVTEIRRIIKNYQNVALSSIRRQKLSVSQAPIEKWLKLMKQISEHAVPPQNVARAFKYIALFEKRTGDSKIDLKQCYNTLHLVMSGNVNHNLNPQTAQFMKKCMKNLAEKLKSADIEKEKTVLSNVGIEKAGNVKSYSRKDSSISNLASDPKINPLGVPKNLLTINDKTVN